MRLVVTYLKTVRGANFEPLPDGARLNCVKLSDASLVSLATGHGDDD